MKTRMKGAHGRRPIPFGDLDKRTYEGRLLNEFREQMVAHVGGNPTVPQAVLIARTAWLALRCSLLEGKLADDALTEQDTRVYLAWNNALRRNLAELGLDSDAEPATKPLNAIEIGQHLAAERAARERADAAE